MRTLSILAVLVWAAAALADEAGGEKPLRTVVVTATRTEQSLESVTSAVSVVGGEEISDRQTPTLPEALRGVSGVDISQSGSMGTNSSVFIRGANADQSLFLVDGVEVNSATLGGFNLGNIFPNNVDRVEILRGAGGALYGSEAIGGVVQMVTRKGEGPFHGTVSAGGGNTDTSSNLAEVSGSEGIVAYTASLGYLTTAGFQRDNDDFSNLTSSARVDVTPMDGGTLRGFFRSANSSLGLANNNIGAGYGDFIDPNARQKDEFYLGKGEWEHSPSENLQYRLSGAYARTLNEFHDTADPEVLTSPNYWGDAFFLSRLRIPSDIKTGEAQVNYTEGAVGLTTLGFDFKEQSGEYKAVNGDGSETRYDHSRWNCAGYAQQQVHLFEDRLSLVGGFRADGNEDYGTEVSGSGSAGYVVDWWDHAEWATHLKGGYAEGFKAPTFNALYYPMFGNKNLDAETSREYSGGLAQYLGLTWLSVEATYFDRRTEHMIQYESVDSCPNADVEPGTYFTPCDIGRADVTGVETALVIGPLAGLSLRGSYMYLDWDLSSGEALLRRPHNRMSTFVNYDRREAFLSRDRVNANVQVLYTGERNDIDPLTYQPVGHQPMFVRVDAAASYDIPRRTGGTLGVFARVQNLFDRDYQEVRGFQSPPINVLAGLRVGF